jgi:hypothetical protein
MGLPRTAWKAGSSGNPLGRQGEKEFAAQLRIAARTPDPVRKILKLRLIAEQLVDQAVAGDLTAIGMVADRLDGRPVSESHVNHHRTLIDMSDQELLAIVVEAHETIEHDPQ